MVAVMLPESTGENGAGHIVLNTVKNLTETVQKYGFEWFTAPVITPLSDLLCCLRSRSLEDCGGESRLPNLTPVF